MSTWAYIELEIEKEIAEYKKLKFHTIDRDSIIMYEGMIEGLKIARNIYARNMTK